MGLSGNLESGLRVFPSAALGGDSVGPVTPLKGRGQIPGENWGAVALCPRVQDRVRPRGQDSAQPPGPGGGIPAQRKWTPGSEASGFTPSPHFPVPSINLGERGCRGPRPDAGSLYLPSPHSLPSPGSFTSALPNTTTQAGKNVPRGLLKFDFALSQRPTSCSTIGELVGNPNKSHSRSTGPCAPEGHGCMSVLKAVNQLPERDMTGCSFQKGTGQGWDLKVVDLRIKVIVQVDLLASRLHTLTVRILI